MDFESSFSVYRIFISCPLDIEENGKKITDIWNKEAEPYSSHSKYNTTIYKISLYWNTSLVYMGSAEKFLVWSMFFRLKFWCLMSVTELWKRVEPNIFQKYPVVPEGCMGITYTATVTSAVPIQAGFPSPMPTETIWNQCVLLFTYS